VRRAVAGIACLWVCAIALAVGAENRSRASVFPAVRKTDARDRFSTQALTTDQLNFFENKVRPVLARNCFQCHSTSVNPPKSGLELDWKGGWEKGGDSGDPAIVAGNPDKSALIRAIRYTDPGLQMPPSGKLTDAEINDLVSWVKMGAPDPRTTRPTPGAAAGAPSYGGQGKNHWAFKPVSKQSPPQVKNAAWV